MLIEILIILLIIIVLFVFLLFFKTWHLHLLFKNKNSNYDLSLDITFLFIQITLNKLTSDIILIVSLNLFSKIKQLFSINLNSNKTSKTDEINDEEKNYDELNDKNNDVSAKIKEICPIILESKEELSQIIKLVIQLIKFKKSCLELYVGLGDNNITIKLCNLLWALSAPLYPLNFQLILIPRINETMIKSNGNICFDMKLFNILKIIMIIIKNNKLRDLLRIIRD